MSLPTIYVLGCDELADRKATALAHLAARNITPTYYRGFHGVSWGLSTTKEFDPGKTISPGHVGLNLGMYSLWQHLHITLPSNGRAIVFEDDAVVPPGFSDEYVSLDAELAKSFSDWDLVFLGLAERSGPGVWNKVTERIGLPDSRLCRLAWPWGTHAILLRARALPVLLDKMAVAERNLDQQLYQRVLEPGLLRWCAVLPSIVTQRTYDYAGTGNPEWRPSTVDVAKGGGGTGGSREVQPDGPVFSPMVERAMDRFHEELDRVKASRVKSDNRPEWESGANSGVEMRAKLKVSREVVTQSPFPIPSLGTAYVPQPLPSRPDLTPDPVSNRPRLEGPSIEYVREHGSVVSSQEGVGTSETVFNGMVFYAAVTLNDDGTICDFLNRKINRYVQVKPDDFTNLTAFRTGRYRGPGTSSPVQQSNIPVTDGIDGPVIGHAGPIKSDGKGNRTPTPAPFADPALFRRLDPYIVEGPAPTSVIPGDRVTFSDGSFGVVVDNWGTTTGGITRVSLDRNDPNAPTPAQLAETHRRTLALIDPYPCLYRGELFEDGLPITGTNRTLPVWECARLNTPCHQKSAGVVTDQPVIACETCPHRLEMAAASAPRQRLPIPDGHFNPSIAVYEGRLILATRDSWGHSAVALWELHNSNPVDLSGEWTCTPIASLKSDHIGAPRLEDPRLFVARTSVGDGTKSENRLHAMFNLPDSAYPAKRVRVGYCKFSKNLDRIEITEIFESPEDNHWEKNWAPFPHPDGWDIKWIYQSKPDHVVYKIADIRHITLKVPGGGLPYVTANPFPWTGGVIRGGAAPVRVGDIYYHFFHGCLKRSQGSVYTVGCLVFEAQPPFRVLRQTPTPLIWPDLPATGEDVVKRYVVWPGGAVLYADHWLLALGIDDSFSRIVRIPFGVVEAALSDKIEDGPVVASIRATEIATGVKIDENNQIRT